MRIVADASVALKWFFRAEDEADAPAALELLRAVGDGRVELAQPSHFLAEVAAVLARESPASAEDDLVDLMQVRMRVVDDQVTHLHAVALSTALGHHLFDTLYHAVAIEHPPAVLVTADERYFRRAHGLGRIVRLADLPRLLAGPAAS